MIIMNWRIFKKYNMRRSKNRTSLTLLSTPSAIFESQYLLK